MNPHPTYVVHDEKRWRVLETLEIDGEPGYLATKINGPAIAIRVTECTVWKRGPRRRIWRSDGCVLESDGRTMSIRKERTRQRWPTSLMAIYSMTVKAHMANEHAKKQRAKARR